MTSYSNLSKLKPAFRTKGNVTGNFGAPKRTREAYNSSLGVTDVKVVKVTKGEDYLLRLYDAFDSTTDENLKKFIYGEIRKILIRNNKWSGDTSQAVH